jgi:hypothetical protein
MQCTPQCDIELVPKKKVLSFKPSPRLEQVGDNRSKQMKYRKHRIERCADSASLPNPHGWILRERQAKTGAAKLDRFGQGRLARRPH